MDTNEFLKRYAKYYDNLLKLSAFPLSFSPTLDELDVSRAVLQGCYRDIKEMDSKLTVVLYLSYISTEFILKEWEKLFGLGLPRNPEDWLLEVCVRNPDNAKNMVRLFCFDNSYFLDGSASFRGTNRYKTYLTVNDYRYMIENELTIEELRKLKNTVG